MGDSSDSRGGFSDSNVIEFTGKVTVVAVVVFFIVVSFVFCIHFSSKWFWRHGQESTAAASTRRRRRSDFSAGHHEIIIAPTSHHGLDPLILKTIPVQVFNPKEFGDELQCSVCLCEIAAGEKARFLPKCNHGFHIDCIDMWFQSHTTCPLCRNPVATRNQSDPASELAPETMAEAPAGDDAAEPPNLPTNVLFWGNETQISTVCPTSSGENQELKRVEEPCSSMSSTASASHADGVHVVDIPRRLTEEEEPKSQTPTRLRSLKRLLIGGGRKVNPCTNRNLELGQ